MIKELYRLAYGLAFRVFQAYLLGRAAYLFATGQPVAALLFLAVLGLASVSGPVG